MLSVEGSLGGKLITSFSISRHFETILLNEFSKRSGQAVNGEGSTPIYDSSSKYTICFSRSLGGKIITFFSISRHFETILPQSTQ